MKYSAPQAAAQRYTLEFRASAGPANPSPARELALVDPDGGEQRASFNNESICRFVVNLSPGKTNYVLRVLSPEQTVTLATDPRDLMVHIDHLRLSKLPVEPQTEAQN